MSSNKNNTIVPQEYTLDSIILEESHKPNAIVIFPDGTKVDFADMPFQKINDRLDRIEQFLGELKTDYEKNRNKKPNMYDIITCIDSQIDDLKDQVKYLNSK